MPIQRPADLDTLRAVVDAGAERGMPVGSGTVISAEQVETTKRLGVFTVAPGFSPEVVSASARLGVPHLPGVSTASTIQQALAARLDWMKAFPASVLDPTWFTSMFGPFPDVKFVATGGISAANAADYLRAGARIISLGSALASPDALELIAARGRPGVRNWVRSRRMVMACEWRLEDSPGGVGSDPGRWPSPANCARWDILPRPPS